MKNRTVSEFGVFRKSEGCYYVVGSTIVAHDINGYYDLVNQRPIEIFDYNTFEINQEGIMFEKNSQYYEKQKDYLEDVFHNYLIRALEELKTMLDDFELNDSRVYQFYKYLLIKGSLANPKTAKVLQDFIVYVSRMDSHTVKMKLDKILQHLRTMKIIYDLHHSKYLDIYINIKLLNDLNKQSRIGKEKSVLLYAQNNRMLPDTPFCLEEVKSLKESIDF